MFSPSLQLGILKASDLPGYPNKPVYIGNSNHVPPTHSSFMDCMDALFECLNLEPHPGMQAVLGHFIFTFIHPFHDNNGRLGRFLMNFMLISGGYPWRIVRSEKKYRNRYLHALETAFVKREIKPFVKMITQEMCVD
ncbi:MAG: Fic family protein [Chthoniobacterales bacterium]|nr:Fic family protein [Chthoniobacterales bacterium]